MCGFLHIALDELDVSEDRTVVDDFELETRDLVLFDETVPERYLDSVCETEYLVYDGLFIMDGNRMSGSGIRAGIWLTGNDGQPLPALPIRARQDGQRLSVRSGPSEFLPEEDAFTVRGGAALTFRWKKEASCLAGTDGNRIRFFRNGRHYALRILKGKVRARDGLGILPEDGEIRFVPERE